MKLIAKFKINIVPNRILEISVNVAVKFGLLMFRCINLIKFPNDFSVFPARAAFMVPRLINSCITPIVTCGVFILTLCFLFKYDQI